MRLLILYLPELSLLRLSFSLFHVAMYVTWKCLQATSVYEPIKLHLAMEVNRRQHLALCGAVWMTATEPVGEIKTPCTNVKPMFLVGSTLLTSLTIAALPANHGQTLQAVQGLLVSQAVTAFLCSKRKARVVLG